MISTRGSKSSEKKACYLAVVVGVAMSVFGIYKGVDLSDLAILVGAVNTPIMTYVFGRSYVKGRVGEKEH